MELISLARRETTGTITVESHRENQILLIGIRAEASCFSPFIISSSNGPESMVSANMKLAGAMIEQIKGQLDCRLASEAWIRMPLFGQNA